MLKKIWTFSAVGLLCCLNIACSGSSSDSEDKTPPPISSQFELNIELLGLTEGNISFNWLGKNYSIDSNQQLLSKNSSYSDPTEFVFPDSHTCTYQVNKITDIQHNLMIECETKASTEFVTISLEKKLPYSVNVKLKDQIYTLEDEGIQTQVSATETPSIISSTGPLLCDLIQNNQSNGHWVLQCEEFLIATEQSESIIDTHIITETKKIPLDITQTTLSDYIQLHSYYGKQFFLLGDTIYSLTLKNGAIDKIDSFSQSFSSLVKVQSKLYSLASTGLYIFSDTEQTWSLIRPITRDIVSPLFVSSGVLSWLTQADDHIVLDRSVSQSNKPSTDANQHVTSGSDYGAISIENGTVWLANNADNHWVLTAVEIMGNHVNQVIQTLNKPNQFALLQASDEKNKLLMIEGDNILSFEIANQSMTWQPFKNTTADLLSAQGNLLVTANQLTGNQAKLNTLYYGNNTLSLNELITHLNLTSDPLITLNQAAATFSSISINTGLLLFYIEGEGSVWVTDGTLNNTKKILENQTWQEFESLKFLASGKSILLLTNQFNNQLTIIPLDI